VLEAEFADLLRDPGNESLRLSMVEALHETHALEAAQHLLLKGLALNGRWVPGHHELGLVLADAGRFGQAIAQFRQVTQLAPAQSAGWANLAAMLKIEGRFDAALKAYDTAVALDPQNARIRVNRTVALLRAGRLREAWRDFEYRLALPEHQATGISWPMPLLPHLSEAIGRHILVTHSDGFGDTLQFMRYLPLLAEHAALVTAWVPKPLERIMQSVEGVAEVQTGDRPTTIGDFYCPFVSLPRVFDTSLQTIPDKFPYLAADPQLVPQWRERLPNDAMLVGLVWAGQARPHLAGFDVLDTRRSTSLATLAPLASIAGIRFVSLQMGSAIEQLREPPLGLDLMNPMAQVTDFADTAAIIANLDVVVSVDTSVAHLAGAMGKPVLLLDRYDNCWRWLSGRVDSPWYPTLRIFRQKRIGEWAPVIDRVAAALTRMARDWSVSAKANHPYQGPLCPDAP
jgi:hypothetical protein